MLSYLLSTINLTHFLTIVLTLSLLWTGKTLFYIISVKFRGLKSFYQVPGYPLLIDWELLRWPVQRLNSDFLLHRRKQLGPIFAIRRGVFSQTIVVITEPSMLESVFKIDGKQPARIKQPGFNIRNKLSKQPKDLVMSSGDDWAKKRKPSSRAMLNPTLVSQLLPELNEIAVNLLERISDSLAENQTCVMKFLIQCTSYESVYVFVHQKRNNCLANKMKDETISFLKSGFEIFHALNLLSGFSLLETLTKAKKLLNTFTPFQNQVKQEINESINLRIENKENFQSDRFDFLTLMLNAKSLTMQEIKVLTYGLLEAGIDTTATTILMTLYHLGLNTDKQTKVREEIDRVVGDRESVIRQDIDSLRYMKLCVREGQRLHPAIIANTRIIKEDLVIDGYHIPKGTCIMMNNFLIGRQANLFSNPDEYIPERWEQPELQKPYYFLPFGSGPRICVGRVFAEQECYTMLVHILRKYNVETLNTFNTVGYLFLEPDREILFRFVPVY